MPVDAGITAPVSDALVLDPLNPVVTVRYGDPLPTLKFTVRDARGAEVVANFQLKDGSLGDIDHSGVFTPAAGRAGVTTVEAQVGRKMLATQLTVEVTWIQNGAPPDPAAGMPAGGYAGVGGEGPGGALTDEVIHALDGAPSKDSALSFLYPYDKTVFPLGLLAPLLMWAPGAQANADGIRIHLSGAHFDYRGDFGRPPALAAGAAFVRHPIPQEVWTAATLAVAGGPLSVELTVARGGKAYGPLKQQWTIAHGSLKGTVYYQSYGTHLVKNATGGMGGDGRFGGATLAIRLGATAPQLVAGSDGGDPQCRVCHSVSSQGNRMTVQHGDQGYAVSGSIDLMRNNRETVYPSSANGKLAWIGLSPDGSIGLGNAQPLGVEPVMSSSLYDMTSGMPLSSTGLSEFVTQAAFPTFAHDGRKVAFNFFSGPGNSAIGMGDGKKLVAMEFDPKTRTFSNPVSVYAKTQAAGFPAFTPTSNGVVYEVELQRNDEDEPFYSRHGGRAELWWTNLQTKEAHALASVNGLAGSTTYLPTGTSGHDVDTQLNYEPSVAPIASGGYAWLVFTSRRLYGNVATVDPWFSDPREHDLSATPTTKKLWIAAIDLDLDSPELTQKIGPDPSHPAFYLPGQELLAGNARGFWAVDPCKGDGNMCESGVDCCSGVCQRAADSGALTCGPKTNACVEEFGRCETMADCCDATEACINHVCTRVRVE